MIARIIFFTAENNTDFHILSKNFMKILMK